MDPTIKVTYLGPGRGWGVRCFCPNGSLFSENTAYSKDKIGPIARHLLRMWDKCGGVSIYAHRARHRAWEKARECSDPMDARYRNRDMDDRQS